jgi:MOSC domain-containing protein YiiM
MTEVRAVLASIQVGTPRRPADEGPPWTTGIFKTAVDGSVDLGPTGLAGDGQADLVNHGGPDKAVCAY